MTFLYQTFALVANRIKFKALMFAYTTTGSAPL